MKRNIRPIPLDLIKLDQENVRFGQDVAHSQREAIELLLSDPEDAKKLLRLASHIARYGLDPTEIQLVTPDGNGCFIVLEGNRRLTALKLLQKPDLCTSEKLYKGFLAAHKLLREGVPNEIDCSVVNSRAEGDMWIELKHTGQNGGIGRVPWDSDIRDERRARQTGVESVGRQVRNLVKNNPQYFSISAIEGVYKIDVTTLTRLFASGPAQETFCYKIENRELKLLVDLKYVYPSIEYAINLFVECGYNVNDIRSDDDRHKFVKLIPNDCLPNTLRDLERKVVSVGNEGATIGIKEKVVAVNGEERSSAPEISSESSVSENGALSGSGALARRAKPSSRVRKYLIPWSLNIQNSRINEIYRELRRELIVDSCPNATAVTFRVFVEVTCDYYIKLQQQGDRPVLRQDNRKPVNAGHAGDNLSVKVISVAKHLEDLGHILKENSKVIIKRAGSIDQVGSVDHLNLFVHGSASPPVPSELKDIADEYRPLLEAIWR